MFQWWKHDLITRICPELVVMQKFHIYLSCADLKIFAWSFKTQKDGFLLLNFLCMFSICALRNQLVLVIYCHSHPVLTPCVLAAALLPWAAELQAGGLLCFMGLWTWSGAVVPTEHKYGIVYSSYIVPHHSHASIRGRSQRLTHCPNTPLNRPCHKAAAKIEYAKYPGTERYTEE